ncbi:MAG: hypothetical protein OEZ39_01565 [Gammaproteobacteria bacterium]|nr:hypothetical protein [Gammaproteobacteria bacterium]MDH5650541.1 hypothetical protein [Gammaproteobacteria bacterium]
MRESTRIILWLVLFCFMPPTMAAVFEVVNVAADDALNLRAEANPASALVPATIPHNAKQVLWLGEQKKYQSSTWYKVRHGNSEGWVNARFLRERNNTAPMLLEELKCLGTEPFWSLDRKGKVIHLKMFNDAESAYTIKKIKTSHNNTNEWLILTARNSDQVKMDIAVSETGQCSDGMSDDSYRYEVRFRQGDDYLNGCCHRISE